MCIFCKNLRYQEMDGLTKLGGCSNEKLKCSLTMQKRSHVRIDNSIECDDEEANKPVYFIKLTATDKENCEYSSHIATQIKYCPYCGAKF